MDFPRDLSSVAQGIKYLLFNSEPLNSLDEIPTGVLSFPVPSLNKGGVTPLP